MAKLLVPPARIQVGLGRYGNKGLGGLKSWGKGGAYRLPGCDSLL